MVRSSQGERRRGRRHLQVYTFQSNTSCSTGHEPSAPKCGIPGATHMIWLHISSPAGVEAEFTVDSPAMAVDLALRSQRAGLIWHAENRADDPAQRLSLSSLRALAVATA